MVVKKGKSFDPENEKTRSANLIYASWLAVYILWTFLLVLYCFKPESVNWFLKISSYERKHSLSLVHADWLDYDGTQEIAYKDDAPRKIRSIGEFTNATTDNTIGVFKRAKDIARA